MIARNAVSESVDAYLDACTCGGVFEGVDPLPVVFRHLYAHKYGVSSGIRMSSICQGIVSTVNWGQRPILFRLLRIRSCDAASAAELNGADPDLKLPVPLIDFHPVLVYNAMAKAGAWWN